MTKVFYSWQSDTPAKVGKRFVQRAISDALKALQSEAEIDRAIRDNLHIDHDTLNVPGSPPIVDTILGKIDNSSAFISDVTFVATRPNGEKVPNPNVCVEHGWALKSLSHNRIMSVLNEEYGSPKDNPLPFDFRHMLGPVIYKLSTTATPDERRTVQKQLTKGIIGRLKRILMTVDAGIDDDEKYEAAKADAEEVLFSFLQGNFQGRAPVRVSMPKLLVGLFPIGVAPPPRLDAKLIERLQNSFAVHVTDRQTTGCDSYEWWASSPQHYVEKWQSNEATWLMRLLRPGRLEYQVTLNSTQDFEAEFPIDGRHLEGKIMRAVDKMCKLMTELGFSGPALAGIAFNKVEGMILTKSRQGGNKIGNPYFNMPSVTIDAMEALDDSAFQDAFDRLWQQSGWPSGSPSFDHGNWEGRKNPSLYDID